jgi:serine/threonine protein kinase
MSPERLAGEGYGAPGDIWSLGILLLEMATRFVQYMSILLVYISLEYAMYDCTAFLV